jgi:hypothetical protein
MCRCKDCVLERRYRGWQWQFGQLGLTLGEWMDQYRRATRVAPSSRARLYLRIGGQLWPE